MGRASLVEFVEGFRRHGGEIAYAEPRGYRTARWSYVQIAETAAQFACELEARGIRPGERVLLWGPNSAEWVAAFWGCVLRGVVVVPMDAIATADFARRVAREVDSRLIVVSRQRLPLASSWPVLALEDLPEAIAHRPRDAYAGPVLDRRSILQIIFTSGTTAEPRGVVISHGNILANLEPLEVEITKYRRYERWVHPLRFLNLVPLSHVFGQFMGLFVPALLPGTVVFSDTLNPAEVLRTIRRERVSAVVTVPRLLEALRDKIERDLEAEGRGEWLRRGIQAAEGERFYRHLWRFRRIHRRFGWKFWAFVSGGAALPAEVESFWDRLGFAVIQGYGLTETTSLVSVNHPFRMGRGSIGKILPGREIKLAENGEILVRGESIAAGYWPAGDAATAPDGVQEEKGWFRTGDIGQLDVNGNLYFKSRKKNVIVTPEGMNIYPGDLEAALRRQPDVRECAVVGLEREGNAEPCAVLLLRDPESAPEPAVRRANELLAGYQQMRHWYAWPEQDFPRTTTGKPRINVIAEAVAAHFRLAPGERAAPSLPLTIAGSGLADILARVTRRAPAQLSHEAQLERDLNLSSMDRVELLSALEDRYQVELNESTFTAATTVGEIERLLRGAAASESTAHPSEYVYPRWAQRWPVRWLRLGVYYLLVWPATHLLAHPRVSGREKLRGTSGPVLAVSNHVSRWTDLGFVLAALPPRLRHRLATAVAGETLQAMRHPPQETNIFLRLMRRLGYALAVALFNVFPLPRKSGFRESFRFAGDLADRGYSVLVFPEGGLTPDGTLQPFQNGIGLLANNLKIPIVPVRIDGLFERKQSGRIFARPGRIRVVIGAPVTFAQEADPAWIAHELRRRVASL